MARLLNLLHRAAHRLKLVEKRLRILDMFGHRWLTWECQTCGLVDEVEHLRECPCKQPSRMWEQFFEDVKWN